MHVHMYEPPETRRWRKGEEKKEEKKKRKKENEKRSFSAVVPAECE